jgi:large subunit ribosomal protein L10
VNRTEKAQVIAGLKEKAETASIAMITDFKGKTVEQTTEFRTKLREAGVEYKVVKNTLARIAFTDTSHEVLQEKLKECCAVMFGFEDPVAAAKVIVEHAKDDKDFVLRGASLEGSLLDEDGLKDLSKMPSKPELQAMLLGAMNAVPTGLVTVLQKAADKPGDLVTLMANVPRGFINCLVQIKDQKEQA